MEAITEHSVGSGSSARSSKLRYPLRSANKGKDEKLALVGGSVSSSASITRGRSASIVSKSVSVLELSGKEKSGKPPRRLSIPPKSSASPLPRTSATMTPMAEPRSIKGKNDQSRIFTPSPGTGKSFIRQRFSVLSSASYWLTQIKLSEAAGKHSISLGFFKLAFECGSEPMQKMQDELKRYVRRNNLKELDEPTKELLKSYDIAEDFDSLSISDASSHVVEVSDDDAKSKRRAVNVEHNARAAKVTKNTPTIHNKPLTSQNSEKSSTRSKGNMQKRSVKSKSNEPKSSEQKSGIEQEHVEHQPTSIEIQQEDKENKVALDHMITSMES